MMLFHSIALVGFWHFAIRLWVLDGTRVPLVFIALYSCFSLGLGAHIFMGVEAAPALVLAIINGYRVPPLI